MISTNIITVRLTILGRVHGVGYRMWACGKARGLKVTGWIRNRADGSVESLVSGDGDAVEAFVTSCEKGPRGAKVEEIITVPEAVQEFSGFEIAPDA